MVLHFWLRRSGKEPAPIMAGLMALGLAIAGLSQLPLAQYVSKTATSYQDTYYIVSRGYFLLNIAAFYLVAAALALLIFRVGRGWPKRILTPMFWLCHLGFGAMIVARHVAMFSVPKRYVDYPEAFYWVSWFDIIGVQISQLGAVGLLVLALVALCQRALQGRVR